MKRGSGSGEVGLLSASDRRICRANAGSEHVPAHVQGARRSAAMSMAMDRRGNGFKQEARSYRPVKLTIEMPAC